MNVVEPFAKLNGTEAGRKDWPGDELSEGVSDPLIDTYEGSPFVAIRPGIKIARFEIAIAALIVAITYFIIITMNLRKLSFLMI